MKILVNPDNGATITNVQINNTKYFVDKPFEIDSLIKIEDDSVADVILNLYEFVREVSLDEAKKYIEDKEKRKFKCERPGCDMATTTELTFKKHMEKHEREEQLDKELGIQVIAGKEISSSVDQVLGQDAIDAQARSDGLFGDGLQEENSRIGARM